MRSLFIGNTNSFVGSSYLDSHSLFTIKHNFTIGSSTESVNRGEFLVNNIDWSVDNQILKINLLGKKEKTLNEKCFIPFSVKSAKTFVLNTYSYDDLYEKCTPVRSGISAWTKSNDSDSFIFQSTSLGIDRLLFSSLGSIQDFECTFKWSRSHTLLMPGMFFYSQNIDESDGYYFFHGNTSTSLLAFPDYLTISNIGTSFAENINYWTNFSVRKGVAKLRYSATGQMDWTVASNVNLYRYSNGLAGLFIYNGAGIGVTLALKELKVNEIKPIYTYGDIIKKSFQLSNNSVSIENSLSGVSSWSSNSGSSFTVGITNGYEQITANLTGVSSFAHSYFISGRTYYDDFVFECEMKGCSFYRSGLMVGGPSRYVFFGQRFSGSTIGLNQEVVLYTNVFKHADSPLWSSFNENNWYNVRLIKNNANYYYLINGILASYYVGTSLNTDVGARIFLGLAVEGNGVSGGKVYWRNPKIEILNQISNEATFDNNTAIRSIVSRYLSNSYLSVNSENNVEIFRFGSSRGIYNLTNDNLIQSVSKVFNSYDQSRVSMTTGNQFISGFYNSDPYVMNNIGIQKSDIFSDQNIGSQTEAKIISDEYEKINRSSSEQYSISIKNIPTLQIYDSINYQSFQNGISLNSIVSQEATRYSPESGFEQEIILNKITND